MSDEIDNLDIERMESGNIAVKVILPNDDYIMFRNVTPEAKLNDLSQIFSIKSSKIVYFYNFDFLSIETPLKALEKSNYIEIDVAFTDLYYKFGKSLLQDKSELIKLYQITYHSSNMLISRTTQTVKTKTRADSTYCFMGTQSKRNEIYLPSFPEKIIIPGSYLDYETIKKKRIEAATVIQKFFRRLKSLRYINHLKKLAKLAAEKENEFERFLIEDYISHIRNEKNKLLYPTTMDDFLNVYSALKDWLDEKKKIIDSMDKNRELIKANLDNHVKIINRIEGIKNERKLFLANKKNLEMLKMASEPIYFKLKSSSEILTIETLETQKGRKLFEIYQSLSMETVTDVERLDILLTVILFLESDPSKPSKELIELIEREAYGIKKNFSPNYLKNLRSRILNRFLAYIKNSKNNPSIQDIKLNYSNQINGRLFRCNHCLHYYGQKQFHQTVKGPQNRMCKFCRYEMMTTMRKGSLSFFRELLNLLRREEIRYEMKNVIKECYEKWTGKLDFITIRSETFIKSLTSIKRKYESKFCFLVTDMDIMNLFNDVYLGKSQISKESDQFKLILTRWDITECWSPWNSVLLTKREHNYHTKLSRDMKPEFFYDVFVVEEVIRKNAEAARLYSRLKILNENFIRDEIVIPLELNQDKIIEIRKSYIQTRTNEVLGNINWCETKCRVVLKNPKTLLMNSNHML